METEEVIKLVDGIYKNILEKFNPGARQLISAGKAYLKALHGAAAASRLFNEALAKIAVNAQQGGTTDIGSALMNIVGVYKEIQDQHMNILKAFYVDLLVPLETNLEKDTKVVQFEQKKFMQQHKVRADSYSKAAATMKKQRKKKPNPQNADKEIKSIQALEEEKNKLDLFCEQSLKNAMTQERRRYGFVLERQCSLAKHWMAYHGAGKQTIEESLENWQDVAATREFLPPNVESMFSKRMVMGNHVNRMDHFSEDDEDRISISSQMRKTQSIDASCLDMKSLGEVVNQMPRAKSEFNLTSTSVQAKVHHSAIPEMNNHSFDQRPMVRALYAYLSSGENQLSFLEGDQIALVGERAKGWQFGENLRTQLFGWFPIAYTGAAYGNPTTPEENPEMKQHNNYAGLQNYIEHHQQQQQQQLHPPPPRSESSMDGTLVEEPLYRGDLSPTRMFGDTIMFRQSKQYRGKMMIDRDGGNPKPGPPPTLPAPVPTPTVPHNNSINTSNGNGPPSKQMIQSSQSFSSSMGLPMMDKRPKSIPATINFTKQHQRGETTTGKPSKPTNNGVTNASLHSSNDSGFSNEPPPQPEVDYSDEETVRRVPIRNPQKKYESNRRPIDGGKMNRSSYNNNVSNTNTMESKKRGTLIRQSSSYGNLADENTMDYLYRTTDRNGNTSGGGPMVKRTKSFWKFGKSDNEDIVEGMAMWKHRDLVQTETEMRNEEERIRETTLKRNKNLKKNSEEDSNKKSYEKQDLKRTQLTNGKSETPKTPKAMPVIDDHAKYQLTKAEIDQRIGKQQKDNRYYGEENGKADKGKKIHENEIELGYEEDEDDLTVDEDKDNGSNMIRMKSYEVNHTMNNKHLNNRQYYEREMMMNGELMDQDLEDERFYDDESVNDDIMAMKTVRRKEILKQYYSSNSDTERHSSSSDPYDCIVVQDHHVVKNKNNLYNNTNLQSNKNNKNKANNMMEFSTFRGEYAINQKNLDLDQSTILPRTKLTKPTNNNHQINSNSNTLKAEKEKSKDQKNQQNIKNFDSKVANNKRKNFEDSKRNSLSSAKSYGPWCDLWGSNNNNPQSQNTMLKH